jgi:hypothetical protein
LNVLAVRVPNIYISSIPTHKLKSSPPPIEFTPLVSENKIKGGIHQPATPEQDKYRNAMPLA